MGAMPSPVALLLNVRNVPSSARGEKDGHTVFASQGVDL